MKKSWCCEVEMQMPAACKNTTQLAEEASEQHSCAQEAGTQVHRAILSLFDVQAKACSSAHRRAAADLNRVQTQPPHSVRQLSLSASWPQTPLR